MDIRERVAESNRIEGILRPPTKAELAEHERFVNLKEVTVDELKRFVSVYQPDAIIRDKSGLNVRIGGYTPAPGGPLIVPLLEDILEDLSRSAWEQHYDYELLHPFTDGNGRSGRALWYWRMRETRMAELGFLHAFYYQTLSSGYR